MLEAAVIRKAQKGNVAAIQILERHYDEYINSLSYVQSVDAKGRTAAFLHTGIRDELHAALIVAILKFDEHRINSYKT